MNKGVFILTRTLFYSMLMILFGLLYEQIVSIPNYFITTEKNSSKLFNNFHSFTNPIQYHALPSFVSIIIILSFWRNKKIAQGPKSILSTCMIVLLLSTFYLIKYVNGFLFFNLPLPEDKTLFTLALQWSVVNLCRMTVLIIALIIVNRIIKQLLRDWNCSDTAQNNCFCCLPAKQVPIKTNKQVVYKRQLDS